jgi:diguanylate cyclase
MTINTSATPSTPIGGRFARRIYPARILGLGLGFFAVAAALLPLSPGIWVWLLLISYAFVWPHIAYLYAIRVSDSFTTGKRQLLLDSFVGGFLSAAMAFNLLPSVLVLTMLSMNNMATGGMRLFGVGLIAQVLGVFSGVVIFGWNPHWDSSLIVIIACIPFLAIHPLAVGMIAYSFATRLHEQKNSLKLLSRTDGLTGLYNRRYWQLRAAEEFERSRRQNHSVTLIMLDIDHFKRINDRYGHSVGDDVLEILSYILQINLRSIDILGRFGGEEFAVVLPETDARRAYEIAERVRLAVAKDKLGEKQHIHCTISLGIAEATVDMTGFDDWLNAADQALYAAKAEGRNRSCVYSATLTSQEK